MGLDLGGGEGEEPQEFGGCCRWSVLDGGLEGMMPMLWL